MAVWPSLLSGRKVLSGTCNPSSAHWVLGITKEGRDWSRLEQLDCVVGLARMEEVPRAQGPLVGQLITLGSQRPLRI